jgi:hypothetical protein
VGFAIVIVLFHDVVLHGVAVRPGDGGAFLNLYVLLGVGVVFDVDSSGAFLCQVDNPTADFLGAVIVIVAMFLVAGTRRSRILLCPADLSQQANRETDADNEHTTDKDNPPFMHCWFYFNIFRCQQELSSARYVGSG